MLKASQSSSWNHSAEVWPPLGWYEIRWRPPSPLRRPSAMARMIAACRSFSIGRSPPRIQTIGLSR